MTDTQTAFTAEPVPLRPEFLSSDVCLSARPFGTRIVIVFGGGGDAFVRGFRFRFTDRFGVTAFPRVTANAAPQSPTPMPAVTVLPPAPTVRANGLRTFPFFLTFECGTFPDGTLLVSVDTIDALGKPSTSQLSVRVAQ